MGINLQSEFDEKPNWIEENDWSPQDRIEWMQKIMAFSPRDWSVATGDERGAPDAEMWAIYLLTNADGETDAWESWKMYCKNHTQTYK